MALVILSGHFVDLLYPLKVLSAASNANIAVMSWPNDKICRLYIESGMWLSRGFDTGGELGMRVGRLDLPC
jgi:hypothetical protein